MMSSWWAFQLFLGVEVSAVDHLLVVPRNDGNHTDIALSSQWPPLPSSEPPLLFRTFIITAPWPISAILTSHTETRNRLARSHTRQLPLRPHISDFHPLTSINLDPLLSSHRLDQNSSRSLARHYLDIYSFRTRFDAGRHWWKCIGINLFRNRIDSYLK